MSFKLIVVTCAALRLAGCVVNPVTGRCANGSGGSSILRHFAFMEIANEAKVAYMPFPRQYGHPHGHEDPNVLQVSIADAKNTLTKLIHRAEDGEVVHITRRGTRVAVLVSESQYERLGVRAERDCWQAIEEWRRKATFDWPDVSDEVVDGWRDRSLGRDFAWPE